MFVFMSLLLILVSCHVHIFTCIYCTCMCASVSLLISKRISVFFFMVYIFSPNILTSAYSHSVPGLPVSLGHTGCYILEKN
jgi:hypothetical protein